MGAQDSTRSDDPDTHPSVADLGLTPSAESPLPVTRAVQLARSLDLDDPPGSGDPLPLPWQWIYFTPAVPTSGLREDGHPLVADSSPLAGATQRVFGGGSMECREPLVLGVTTTRTTAIVGYEEKEARTGTLRIVTVAHTYSQGAVAKLHEEQTLIYRTPTGDSTTATDVGGAVEAPAGKAATVVPTEIDLFRYSALTFNAHRIHYDRPYAVGAEGYPGLVVHAPLVATHLAAVGGRVLGREPTAMTFRARTPTFAGVPIHMVVDDATGSEVGVRAVRSDGRDVMTATLS